MKLNLTLEEQQTLEFYRNKIVLWPDDLRKIGEMLIQAMRRSE